MRVISFNRKVETDQSLLDLAKAWWRIKDGGHEMPEAFISDYGFMAFSDTGPICSVFMYPILGCETCLWALHVSSPNSTKEQRGEAIQCLSQAVEKAAVTLGYKAILGYPKMESITQRMVDNGFKVIERGANQCIKFIGG